MLYTDKKTVYNIEYADWPLLPVCCLLLLYLWLTCWETLFGVWGLFENILRQALWFFFFWQMVFIFQLVTGFNLQNKTNDLFWHLRQWHFWEFNEIRLDTKDLLIHSFLNVKKKKASVFLCLYFNIPEIWTAGFSEVNSLTTAPLSL